MVTRYKPTLEARSTTHPAQALDYEKLASAVVQAIVKKQRDVIIRIAYFAELAGDFPKGVIVKKDEHHNYYRAKAFRLADWLHSKGFLPDNARGIVKSMRQVNNLVGVIERMLDKPDKMLYNDRIEVKEEEPNGTNGIGDADSSDDEG